MVAKCAIVQFLAWNLLIKIKNVSTSFIIIMASFCETYNQDQFARFFVGKLNELQCLCSEKFVIQNIWINAMIESKVWDICNQIMFAWVL
jgi:hypothetical protein